MDDLLREFVGETLDMMDAVAGDLVAWEADPADRSGLDGIFRTVHTVKGSSGFFDLPRITAIAHAAEELLDVLRSRKGAPTRASVAMVLVAFDKIRELTHAISTAGAEPPGDDSRLIVALLADIRTDDRKAAQAGGALPDFLDAKPTAGDADDGHDGPHLPADDVPQAWRSVRVPLELLDELMSGVSDLVLARNEVAAQLRSRGQDVTEFAAFERMSQLLGAVRSTVSNMRMVPLRHLYAPLPRLVRQVADELGKQVTLSLEGSEVEIDRELVEALRDPMLHMLRNAIDHGLESASARAASGKSLVGKVTVAARQVGNRILISISDDGGGLPIEAIVARAMKAGHVKSEDIAGMDEARKAELVFLPGLSTAQAITGISGRGVGMDVVRANIERLGGVIRIASKAGEGVTLTLDVPMTLTIISALAVDAGNQSFAIPRSVIDEVMLVSSDAVQRHDMHAAGLVRIRDRVLPHVRLETILGLPDAKADGADRALIICRQGGGAAFALEVPDVRDHEELVIKPLPPILLAIGLYSGLSLPDNGQPMLVLDMEGIARRHIGSATVRAAVTPKAVEQSQDDGRASWLTYRDHNGQPWRAVPMAHVERICDIALNHIHASGGRMVAKVDEQLLAVAAECLPETSASTRRMIRLSDGYRTVMLPASQIGDTVELKAELAADDIGSGLIGMALLDGALVELVDSYGVLASHGETVTGPHTQQQHDEHEPAGGAQPLWIVDPAGGEWAASFLVPTLTAAGYQVALVSDRQKVTSDGAPVISLTSHGPAELLTLEAAGTVHRMPAYDRSTLMRIIEEAPEAAPNRSKRKGRGASA